MDSLFEVLKFEVGVELRRIQVTMAEQLLHVTDAGAGAQEMRCARVTKGVRRDPQSGLQSIVANAVGDHLIRAAPLARQIQMSSSLDAAPVKSHHVATVRSTGSD